MVRDAGVDAAEAMEAATAAAEPSYRSLRVADRLRHAARRDAPLSDKIVIADE